MTPTALFFKHLPPLFYKLDQVDRIVTVYAKHVAKGLENSRNHKIDEELIQEKKKTEYIINTCKYTSYYAWNIDSLVNTSSTKRSTLTLQCSIHSRL